MKKVSIIVPVYNTYDKIDKCIERIINQTYKNIELLLINDGSTDNSIKKLKKYEKKYDFIKVIDKKNEGVSKTRNLGIKEACGDYIMFIDNDDYIDIDYVENYINVALENNSDVVIGGFRRVDYDGKEKYKKSLKDTYWSRYNIITPWAKLYKRKFLVDNKIEFLSYGIGEDVYFNLLLYSKEPKTNIINYIGYNWLDNEISVSNTKHKGLNKEIDILYLLDKIYDIKGNTDIYINYYIKKFYIWYLLYSGRYATKSDFVNEYFRIKEWIKNKNIKFEIGSFSRKINGESLKNRLIVFNFRTLEHLHLIKLFSCIYCRGDKNE